MYPYSDAGGIRPAFYLDRSSTTLSAGLGSEITPYIPVSSPNRVDFKGSSLGDPSRVPFNPNGGQHALSATYQNSTNQAQNTTFIVVVRKNSDVPSINVMNGIIPANGELTFNKDIAIPSTTDADSVSVDFLAWESLSSMRTKHDTVKNSINNVR